MTVDTDVTLIEEELVIAAAIVSWLVAESQPAQAAFQHYKDIFDMIARADRASQGVAVTADIFAQNTRHFEGAPQASRASYGGDF